MSCQLGSHVGQGLAADQQRHVSHGTAGALVEEVGNREPSEFLITTAVCRYAAAVAMRELLEEGVPTVSEGAVSAQQTG